MAIFIWQYKVGTGAITGFDDDISTFSYDSVALSLTGIAGASTLSRDMLFNDDGTVVYVLETSSPDAIYWATLTNPYDLSAVTTGFNSTNRFSLTGQLTSDPSGMIFSPDGTKLLVSELSTETIYEYTLTTPFDLSGTVTYNQSYLVTQGSSLRDINFNDDGTKMYAYTSGTDSLYQYTLGTPYTLNTVTYDSVSFSTSTEADTVYAFKFSTDGTKLFTSGFNSSGQGRVWQYSLTTAFDISSASYDNDQLDVNAQTSSSAYGIVFDDIGSKMFLVDSNGDEIVQYSAP